MKNRFLLNLAFITFIFIAGLETKAAPIWTYPGCENVTDADFEFTTLVQAYKAPDEDLQEPTKMDFDMDSKVNVDIYFVEIRPGNIKRYSAATKTVKILVKLPNWGDGSDYQTVGNRNLTEEGVTGIVLDPNFKTNRYLYVHWSPLPDKNEVFRVSRFTVSGDTIPLSSEKIILEIPAQRQTCCHTGGGMAFDAYGDLWISQGANGGRLGNNATIPPEGINEEKKYESEEWGTASTKGLRGAIIRIHPDNSVRGYSIPKDNFGEYFAKQTGNQQYLDTSKVSPEIYIKGTRNAYSLTLDPVKRWVMWGDIGPDVMEAKVREEANLRKTPGFEGWPYFVGKNTSFSGAKNAALPTNTSRWNTGLGTLPPARPAFYLHTLGTAPIVGPIYRYDGSLNSKVKFPPHFTRKWFVADYQTGDVNVLTLDANGDSVVSAEKIFANHNFSGPLDFKTGPDGALYVINYGTQYFATGSSTSIEKITYKGSCRPLEPKLEQASGVTALKPNLAKNRTGYLANFGAGQLLFVPPGKTHFAVYNLSGKKVWERRNLYGSYSFRLPVALAQGALQFRWE